MLFGGYVNYPGSTEVLGSLSLGQRGVTMLSLRRRNLPGTIALLTKRFFSPVEQFAFHVTWWPYFHFALYLGLVPEMKFSRVVATVLMAVALLLGRGHLDLWGDHRWTGGLGDFFGTREYTYTLMTAEEVRRKYAL